MKTFITKVIIFSAVLLVSFYWILSSADGYSDPYYIRLATPKQTSLILGASRSAQGLQPEVINGILNRNDLFNFSFTLLSSPFGETYLESIKKKLNQNSRNGIFIISVNPWSISSMTEDPDDITNFRENDLFLKTNFVNLPLNLIYLLNFYNQPYISLLSQKSKKMFVHDDGWLEVSIPMDSTSKQKRLEEKIAFYKENYLPKFKFSSIRYGYLSKTIEFLHEYGEVYLVRLPAYPDMMELDDQIVFGFDEKIESLCNEYNIGYLTFKNELLDYEYTDGNHLWKESGTKISERIAKWILDN